LLLGDACLETQNQGRTYRVKVEQSGRHETYLRHLHMLFEPWVRTGPRRRVRALSNGTRAISWGFSTVSHGAFRFYAGQFYPTGKKRVPRLIHRWLTPHGLAYWFMDDGSMKSRQSKGVIFNTQGFSRSDVERLIETLRSRFKLQAKMRHQKEGDQIYLSGRSFGLFRGLVSTHLIPEMRYKLPGEQICLKSNGGAPRFPQRGWQSRIECKGIRELNCESDRTSRDESRS
jgi:hypothetical protein